MWYNRIASAVTCFLRLGVESYHLCQPFFLLILRIGVVEHKNTNKIIEHRNFASTINCQVFLYLGDQENFRLEASEKGCYLVLCRTNVSDVMERLSVFSNCSISFLSVK